VLKIHSHCCNIVSVCDLSQLYCCVGWGDDARIPGDSDLSEMTKLGSTALKNSVLFRPLFIFLASSFIFWAAPSGWVFLASSERSNARKRRCGFSWCKHYPLISTLFISSMVPTNVHCYIFLGFDAVYIHFLH
jgi:hypothetical protein